MRASISRHEVSTRAAPRPTARSAQAVSARHQQRELHAGSGPGLMSGLLLCNGPPFSRMCARMRNHSTASPAPSASSAPAALIDIGVNLYHAISDAARDGVIDRAPATRVL